MKSIWQFQNAKNKFNKIVNHALTQGHQLVTKSGKPLVYIIAAATFNKIGSPFIFKGSQLFY